MKKYLTYNGEKHSIIEWSRMFNMPYETLRTQIRRGDYSSFDRYFRIGLINDPKPIKYIQAKIHMLRNDFYINLTNSEIAHFYSLKTESAVDQYAHDIIMEKL